MWMPACRCAWNDPRRKRYLHALKAPTHALNPSVVQDKKSHKLTPTDIHSGPHPPLQVSLKGSLKPKSHWHRWAATVFIRWQPLRLTALIHLASPRSTEPVDTPLPPYPLPSIPFLCRHRCPRSYTLWVGTDGSYSSPSIRALSGEQGDHSPLDCILACVFVYIFTTVIIII